MLVNREFNLGKMQGQKDAKGNAQEKYIPRKCSATSKIIAHDDVSSVQLIFPKVRAIRDTG
jgi:hypothetical protein